jgi:hypothetical protein
LVIDLIEKSEKVAVESASNCLLHPTKPYLSRNKTHGSHYHHITHNPTNPNSFQIQLQISFISMSSKTKTNKPTKTNTNTKIKTKQDELTKKYFKFKAGDEKQVRTHLPSAQLHMRRQRLARMHKLSPDVIRQLRTDVRKEVLGDSLAGALDYARRNMACVIFFGVLQRYVSGRINKAFYVWKYSKLCISCLRRERLLVHAEEEKRELAEQHRTDAIKRIARRYLQKASMVGAFKVWKEDSKFFAESAQRKRRALKWFTNRKLMMCFESWKDLLAKRLRVRQLLQSITHKRHKKMLRMGWLPWKTKIAKAIHEEKQAHARALVEMQKDDIQSEAKETVLLLEEQVNELKLELKTALQLAEMESTQRIRS